MVSMSQRLNPLGGLMMGFAAQHYLGAPHAIALFTSIALVLAFLSGLASKDVRGL